MIIGNQQAQEMVQRFFVAFKQGETAFPFLLLQGRKHLGKTTLIDQIAKWFLGEYAATDYLPLYDFSSQLGKDHTLKVETSRDQEFLEIDGKIYSNMGMRSLTKRLSLAPVGAYKVVYLENIDRMTGAAANALLKTLEEPLPGRLIIASVSHTGTLLDTIRSRALIVPFVPLSPDELHRQLQQIYPEVGSADINFACSFSLGAWWLAVQLLEDSTRDERAKLFRETKERFLKPERIDLQLTRLKRFVQQGQLDTLLDALLYMRGNDPATLSLTDRLVRTKKLLDTNVSQDHILFWLCVSAGI